MAEMVEFWTAEEVSLITYVSLFQQFANLPKTRHILDLWRALISASSIRWRLSGWRPGPWFLWAAYASCRSG